MLVKGKAGQQSVADGAPENLRVGKLGDLIVSELHGRYFEQAARGNVFSAASQAVATTTVGLATTYTGLCLSNPIGSRVALALLKASLMQSVIQATQPEAFAIAFGFNAGTNVTHTTPATPQPTLIGAGSSAAGKADVSATLPTAPVYGELVANTASATVLGSGGVIDFEGSVILLPGAYACWVTPGQASVAGMWFSFMWEEVPLNPAY